MPTIIGTVTSGGADLLSRGYVDVRDFGAVPDSSPVTNPGGGSGTDSTAAIQAAINAAAGRVVLIAGGRYKTTAPLQLRQGTEISGLPRELYLVGIGGSTSAHLGVIDFYGGSTDHCIVADYTAAANSTTAVRNLGVIDQRTTPTSGNGIHFAHVVNNTIIRKVHVYGFETGAGIRVTGGGGSLTTDCINIDDVWVNGCQYGIWVDSTDNMVFIRDIKSDNPAGVTLAAIRVGMSVRSTMRIEGVKNENNTTNPTILIEGVTTSGMTIDGVISRAGNGGPVVRIATSSGAGITCRQLVRENSGTMIDLVESGYTVGPTTRMSYWQGGNTVDRLRFNKAGISSNAIDAADMNRLYVTGNLVAAPVGGFSDEGKLTVAPDAANQKALTVRGFASQSVDIMRIADSANAAIWRVASDSSIQNHQPTTFLAGVLESKRTAVADANYTILATDHRVLVTSLTAARTLTLPAPVDGKRIEIIDASGQAGSLTLTVSRSGSALIDGATTATITQAYGALRLWSNGTHWYSSRAPAPAATGGTGTSVGIPALETTQLYGYGHSWLKTNPNPRTGTTFMDRLVKRLNMLGYTNQGQGGSFSSDMAANILRTWTLGSIGVVGICGLLNDSISTQAALDQSVASMRCALATLTAGAKYEDTSTSMVFTGTWTAITNDGIASSSTSKTTTTTGDSFDVAWSGDTCYVVVRYLTTAVTVTGTVQPGGAAAGTFTLPAGARTTPGVIKLSGYGTGSHQVRLTLTTGASLTVDCLLVPSTTPPTVFLIEEPGGGTWRTTTLYPAIETMVAADFPSTIVLPPVAGWDATAWTSADGQHLSDQGDSGMADAIVAAFTAANLTYRTGQNWGRPGLFTGTAVTATGGGGGGGGGSSSIAVDSSSPSSITGSGSTTVTTASFSPPANALLVAMVAGGFATAGTTQTSTVTDSLGGTWTRQVRAAGSSGFNTQSDVWTRQLGSSAPGAMTVSAAFTTTSGGTLLDVKVLTGTKASQAGAATATYVATTAATTASASITTTAAGSVVFGVIDDSDAHVVTANGNTTILTSVQGSSFTQQTSMRSTGAVTSAGAVTIGGTIASANGLTVALLEILAA